MLGCDSEALRRNRLKLGLGAIAVWGVGSATSKIGVGSDSEALLQAVRCFGVLGCDSEALRRNRLKLVVCDI